MPEQITTTVYTIHELSGAAQRRAIDRHRDFNVDDSFWYEHLLGEYFPELAAEKGFEITTHPVRLMNGSYRQAPDIFFSGFASQGDGCSFEADVDIEKFILSRKLGKKYRMILDAVRRDWSVWADVHKSDSHYSHEYTMYAHADSDFDPESESGFTIRNEGRHRAFYILLEEFEDEVQEEARSLARDFYTKLQEEYDYLTSEEQIIESLDANGMQFTEDGNDF